jgi:hypothetical protein
VSFNTFLPRPILEAQVPTSHLTLSNNHHIGLSEWHKGYEPGAADYEAYESVWDAFLRSLHARAALLKGGIIWHLAMEFFKPGLVLASPSDDALTHGQSFHPAADAPKYCDDELMSDELDLVCGVYQVQTGIFIFNILSCCLLQIFQAMGGKCHKCHGGPNMQHRRKANSTLVIGLALLRSGFKDGSQKFDQTKPDVKLQHSGTSRYPRRTTQSSLSRSTRKPQRPF